jgi:hypothetical protein
MPSPTSSSDEGRYIPYPGQQGWGFAAFICILTAALYFGAYMIHKATYKLPIDPTDIPSAQLHTPPDHR